MTRIHRLLIAAALAGILLSPAWAAPASESGRWSLTATFGVSLAARLGSLVPLANTADVPGVEVRLEPRTPEAGAWLGCRISDRFEIQAGASAHRAALIDDVGIGLAGIPLGESLLAHVSALTVGARLLYFPLAGGGIEPYLTAGAGITALDAGELGSKTRPSIEAGIGIRGRLSNRLKAVLEVRDAISFFRYFEDYQVGYILIYTAETAGVQHRIGVRLGLDFGF